MSGRRLRWKTPTHRRPTPYRVPAVNRSLSPFRGQFVTAISRVESVNNMFIDSDLALERLEFGPTTLSRNFILRCV
jgi:hypothetical protein